MDLQKLLDENLIESFTASSDQIKQKISIAVADLDVARSSINGKNARSIEWAYAQA